MWLYSGTLDVGRPSTRLYVELDILSTQIIQKIRNQAILKAEMREASARSLNKHRELFCGYLPNLERCKSPGVVV